MNVDRSEYWTNEPYKPKLKRGQAKFQLNSEDEDESSDETDEEFEWYKPEEMDKESYIVILNH
jgi:hypothetical protein